MPQLIEIVFAQDNQVCVPKTFLLHPGPDQIKKDWICAFAIYRVHFDGPIFQCD